MNMLRKGKIEDLSVLTAIQYIMLRGYVIKAGREKK